MLRKFLVALLLLFSVTSCYLVPHNFNPEIDDSMKEIPEGLSEDQFQQLVDDTFELIREHDRQQQEGKKYVLANENDGKEIPKLRDYTNEYEFNLHKDTYRVVNDLDDGIHAADSAPGMTNGMFVVVPDEKSGDFDIFYKKNNDRNAEGSSSSSNNNSTSNRDNVQRDTFNVENDFEDEQARLEEFNRLKDDSNVKVENETFNIKNDLDEDKGSESKDMDEL